MSYIEFEPFKKPKLIDIAHALWMIPVGITVIAVSCLVWVAVKVGE